MRKLTHQEILSRQKEKTVNIKTPLCVVLNSVRSLYNVGSVFRSADGAGVEKIWITGITGHPPNNQISKTALGAEESVDWEYREDIVEVIKELKQKGYSIILLEQMAESIVYQDWMPQEKTCLIVGNEVEGVSEDIVDLCDQAIEIEMAGLKNSLNVSVAFGIIEYHFKNNFKRI